MNATTTKTAVATQLEYGAGNSGCQPPRNSNVATHVMVTMLAYSDMKKQANFMLLYSVWNPATSSFSASGRSNGTRLVSANPAIRKMTKPTICGIGSWNTFHLGRKPR